MVKIGFMKGTKVLVSLVSGGKKYRNYLFDYGHQKKIFLMKPLLTLAVPGE
jgi:hypothetical protein